jgi:O-6-methylguanine DNA methyltransferase
MRLTLITSEGEFVATYSERGLCALDFPATAFRANGAASKSRSSREREAHASTTPEIRRWHQQTERAVKAVLAGQPVKEWPPLDLSAGTSFQQAVWQALQGIPAGQTLSYGEVARQVGKPGAARAVGAACGANPIPVLVPCHRVLASGGALGGFTAGLDWKRRLLAREGVTLC